MKNNTLTAVFTLLTTVLPGRKTLYLRLINHYLFVVEDYIKFLQAVSQNMFDDLILYGYKSVIFIFCWHFIHLSSRWSLSFFRVGTLEALLIWIGKCFSHINKSVSTELRLNLLQLLYQQVYVVAFATLWNYCVTSWSDAHLCADIPNVFNSYFLP